MSGQGMRYQKVGYTQPKPLIPVSGLPMIERLLSCFPAEWPCTFVLAENHLSTELPILLKRLRPHGNILSVPIHSEGPSRAILAGLDGIAPDERILVSYCDYGMVWDAAGFDRMTAETQCDAALISYTGFHAHYLSPVKYAYSRMQGERVVEVREKGSFTENRENEYASSGGYYFRNREILKSALEAQSRLNLRMNGEAYTSLTVEALLRSNPAAQVRVFPIPYFFQWGTPQDLWDFEYWEKTFKFAQRPTLGVEQLLMPMAGLGSRFKELTFIPKPFIPVRGKEIYRRAVDSLPRSKHTQFVALQEHRDYLKRETDVEFLEATPAGQALSTAAGLTGLDLTKEVLVSSCDHELYVSESRWNELMMKKPDAVVFTVRGFPGAHRSPNSFAYVQVENVQDPVGKVQAVSVKKPLSDTPAKDPLLVGTFWFCTAELLSLGIEQLIAENKTVNGELYLDGIFNSLLKTGKRVHVCEAEGYINWGDPQSMAEALYWSEVFLGPSVENRTRYQGVFP